MDWAKDFYSRTGAWWGPAEARIGDEDHRRVALVHAQAGVPPRKVLELGPGYGATAVTAAKAGHAVTAVEISDRADFTAGLADDVLPGSLSVVRDDFYTVELDGTFDVVMYWSGFGIGSDAEQRRLLRRIAGEWLAPGGVALIDVYNPFVWASWHGDEEHRLPAPDLGYTHELHEHTSFDPVTCTATDTWWDASTPQQRLSQSLRCYTPADLMLLLDGTGLALSTIVVGDREFPPGPQPGLAELLTGHHEYLAVLRAAHRRAGGAGRD